MSRSLLPIASAVPIFSPLLAREVGVVFYPGCGNSGDRLIELATLQLLRRFGIRHRVLDDPRDAGGCDVLLLGGGGNFGHANCPVEAGRRRLAVATCKPCVLLPQTCYGREEHGTLYGMDPHPAYDAAFVRDVKSLDYLPGATLAPDLVMTWEPERPLPPVTVGRGEFFHQGGEGLFAGRGSDPRDLFDDPLDYFDFVASHKRIETDSLHCCLIGLIAGRSVTLYPTKLHKCRSFWVTWGRHFPNCAWGGD